MRATSVLQQAHDSTLSKTSIGPGLGVGNSLISNWLGPIKTAAFMVSGIVGIEFITFLLEEMYHDDIH
jgi:hypothetical protein